MRENIRFAILYTATILVLRIWLWVVPAEYWFYHDQWHHIYAGLLLFPFFYMYNRWVDAEYVLPFAIILALIGDEWTFLPMTFFAGIEKEAYYSFISMGGAILSIVLVWIYSSKMSDWLRSLLRSSRKT